MGNITLGPGAVSYLTESIHGAGSPRAQKIMTTRLADIESAKSCCYKLRGIRMYTGWTEICEFNERDALCQPAFPPVIMLHIPVTLLSHRGQA